MFIEFHDDESIVTRSCTWCGSDMPMMAEDSADMADEALFCNECVAHADPFIDSHGLAIAWPGCGEYVYLVKQTVKEEHAKLDNTCLPQHYEDCLMLASLETASQHAYGHTANDSLNGIISSAACKWGHGQTERIALSTN